MKIIRLEPNLAKTVGISDLQAMTDKAFKSFREDKALDENECEVIASAVLTMLKLIYKSKAQEEEVELHKFQCSFLEELNIVYREAIDLRKTAKK